MYPQDTSGQQIPAVETFDPQAAVQTAGEDDQVLTAALERLENGIGRLAEKMAALQEQYRKLQEEKEEIELENLMLKDEASEQEQRHRQTVTELNEALKVQVSQLRDDMQKRLDDLTAENVRYRRALENGADGIERLLADWGGA
ncbi:hypothetical protein [Neisseria leonii]|uniref:hypothetical protein n=1 Tax=Neisseria leonii TaxID=2995413 RepID=UPI00237C04F8|nr:hypothetical protein [Neisseria sp. 3986]MDD9324920.1 hypothetical protein [Neisseria sp. 3986]